MEYTMKDLGLDWGIAHKDHLCGKDEILARRGDGFGAAVLYGKVIWPEFVEVDGYVFVKIQFDRKHYDSMRY